MKQSSTTYRVLVPTALFGTVRVTKGDVIPRELLGCNVRRLVDMQVVEEMVHSKAVKSKVVLM